MQKNQIIKNGFKIDADNRLIAILITVTIIIAIWTRTAGLAERQLAQDEYYFIKSVKNILEFGVPRFSDGGYYIRGILLQYLTAISIYLFGDENFAYRLPSALFGVGTVIMAYFLGRQFLNRSWSILLVIFLSLSSWQIEFDRFARMYSAFQFATVCFFWSLYRFSFHGESKQRYWAVAFAIIGILFHELGIFLALFLFLQLPSWNKINWREILSRQRFYIAISTMVLLFGFFMAQYDFRLIGVNNHLPSGFLRPISEVPNWISFGNGIFGKNGFWAMGILTGVILGCWYILQAKKNPMRGEVEERLLGGLIVLSVWSAFLHQFALSGLIIMIVVLRKPKIILLKPYVYLFLLLIVLTGIWLTLLFMSQGWMDTASLSSILRDYRKAIRQHFFSFPDIYLPVINVWAVKLPVLGSLLGAAIIYQIILIRKLEIESIVKNPTIPIIIVILVVGISPPQWLETRYTHFIYPLGLLVGLISANQLGETIKRYILKNQKKSIILAMGLCLTCFFISEDFNAYHLFNINSDKISFRMGKYEKYSSHWYQRWDFESPAKMIDSDGSADSKVIVSCDADTTGYYLKKEFAIFFPMSAPDFRLISRDGGRRELWSGKRMISNMGGIKDFTENARYVWLVLYPKWGSLKLDPEEMWPGRVKNVEIFQPGRDKRIEVWKIDLKSNNSE